MNHEFVVVIFLVFVYIHRWRQLSIIFHEWPLEGVKSFNASWIQIWIPHWLQKHKIVTSDCSTLRMAQLKGPEIEDFCILKPISRGAFG